MRLLLPHDLGIRHRLSPTMCAVSYVAPVLLSAFSRVECRYAIFAYEHHRLNSGRICSLVRLVGRLGSQQDRLHADDGARSMLTVMSADWRLQVVGTPLFSDGSILPSNLSRAV